MRSLLLITARSERIYRSQLDAIDLLVTRGAFAFTDHSHLRSHLSTTTHTLPPIPDSRFPIPNSKFAHSKFAHSRFPVVSTV
ncbi:MAG: hypothetical protein F6J94_17525 [Moorea sp. SIO1F2]|uniref:hypothetical protein n=1 Tax=unclassified Moorena TaxID=2683338 RepID=UPI0013B7810F|nr:MULTISPECIES: hypothetical protein [unclassified Moorena]NEO15331.1 hypothetical protein [Moorena sp. SIO3E8]NEQ01732.1 hypothetical protein [Moorena sp. SIO3F7]NET83651.1 hypothetical protein [Moorena sp. SIO1F2]